MADTAPSEPTPLRPLAPVAGAIADALAACGWDGTPDVIGGDVRLPDGMPIGKIVIEVAPYSFVAIEGRVKRVAPEVFLEALRTSWRAPLPSTRPDGEQPDVEAASGAEREAMRARFRTPFPWET